MTTLRQAQEKVIQANDIAATVIDVHQKVFGSNEYVHLDIRYGIADALWDKGYRKAPALKDGAPDVSRREIHTSSLLVVFRPGDYPDRTWPEEFAWLWEHDTHKMDMLTTSIQETGIREPILLGSDGRIWDGHHRLAAAMRLGIDKVPVVFSGTAGD